MIPRLLENFWQELPAPVARIASGMLSLTAGFLVAVVLHYVLYRISLPGTPFIYVVF